MDRVKQHIDECACLAGNDTLCAVEAWARRSSLTAVHTRLFFFTQSDNSFKVTYLS